MYCTELCVLVKRLSDTEFITYSGTGFGETFVPNKAYYTSSSFNDLKVPIIVNP